MAIPANIDDLNVFADGHTIFLDDIFQYQFGHTAQSAADNGFSFQIIPFKIMLCFAGHKKIPCPLCQL